MLRWPSFTLFICQTSRCKRSRARKGDIPLWPCQERPRWQVFYLLIGPSAVSFRVEITGGRFTVKWSRAYFRRFGNKYHTGANFVPWLAQLVWNRVPSPAWVSFWKLLSNYHKLTAPPPRDISKIWGTSMGYNTTVRIKLLGTICTSFGMFSIRHCSSSVGQTRRIRQLKVTDYDTPYKRSKAHRDRVHPFRFTCIQAQGQSRPNFSFPVTFFVRF